MKKLLSLLLMVLMLLGALALRFAEENEEDTTPVVAPIVTFKSGFYVGYLDREIKITVSCKNKSAQLCRRSIWSCATTAAKCWSSAFWRNPRYDLTFSVYVTEDMLGRQQAVRLAGRRESERNGFLRRVLGHQPAARHPFDPL